MHPQRDRNYKVMSRPSPLARGDRAKLGRRRCHLTPLSSRRFRPPIIPSSRGSRGSITPEENRQFTPERRTLAMRRFLAVLALVASLAVVNAGIAAAKGPGGGGGGGGHKGGGGTTGNGTISLVLMNSTDGLAHYGQNVTFNISTTATDQPWVYLVCR